MLKMLNLAFIDDKIDSGRSVVRLAHLVWDEGVAGSNPAAPTIKSTYIQYLINHKAKSEDKPED